MGFESSTVMEMLQRLESLGSEARPHAADVAAALSQGGFRQAFGASTALHRSLGTIVEINASLAAHVIPADGLGEPGDCLGELAIRSRAMVLMSQLSQLRDTLQDPTVRARTAGWFAGRFRHIDHIVGFVQDELQRIHGIWRPYRPKLDTPGSNRTDQLAVYRYRITVRMAQQALEEMAIDSDFAYFLQCGASSDCPELGTACKDILTALAIRIDMTPRGMPRGSPSTSDGSAHSSQGTGRRQSTSGLAGRFYDGVIVLLLRMAYQPLRALVRSVLRTRDRPRGSTDEIGADAVRSQRPKE